MGGLPKRGVKDLAFQQKFEIEKSIRYGKPVAGFSLDLVKAFNTFGRKFLLIAMTRLGIPRDIVLFWIRSLANLVRYPVVSGRLGPGVKSTCGAPEGDSMSVLAMLALSAIFYYRLCAIDRCVQPYIYADNWAWMTSSRQAHFQALLATLNFCAAIAVTINFDKTWHFATSKELREFVEVLQLLFPSNDVQVQLRTGVKDLGEVVTYNRFVPLDFIKERIQQAISRMRRLRHLPCDMSDKCRIIQSSAWPAGLYAADTTYVGKKHFHDLRNAAVHAIIGNRDFANARVSCFALSKFLQDPMVFVLCNILRTTRRLAERNPEACREFISMVVDFEGKRAYGPASTFKLYLDNLGWIIQPDGSLLLGEFASCNIVHDSIPFITKCVKDAWPSFALSNVDRKGIGDFEPHPTINSRVLAAFADQDQKLLAYFFLGAFQPEAIKHKWKKDHAPTCAFCTCVDTRPHRYLDCQCFQHIRNDHPDAVRILKERRPSWVYMPIAQKHPDFDSSHFVFSKFPHASEFAPCFNKHQNGVATFYTDGGAIHPQYGDARLASWSVVQDISCSGDDRRLSVDFAFCKKPHIPMFHTIAVGLVPGPQTSGRGELYALLVAIRSASLMDRSLSIVFVTDAQYAITVIENF